MQLNLTGLMKLFHTRTKLLDKLKGPSNTTPESERDDDSATALTNILSSRKYHDILQEFNSCSQILQGNAQENELVPKSDVQAMKQILKCVIDNEDSDDEATEEDKVILVTWKLVEQKEWEQVTENLAFLLKRPQIHERSVRPMLQLAEVKLLQGHLLASMATKSELKGGGVLDCLQMACRLSRIKFPLVDLESIYWCLKGHSIRYKALKCYVKVLVDVGLSREIRLGSRELLSAAANLCSLPKLNSSLLNCTNIHLKFDDCMEAQVKLREIENLLKETIVPKAVKSKPKSLSVKTEDDICASPVMPKVTYDLKTCLKANSDTLSKDDIILYFTYQGVIWCMQGATEEGCRYFHQVVQVLERNRSCESYKALKWMIEIYGQMQDFPNAWRAMEILKKCPNEDVWRPYFIEAAISLSQSEQTRADFIPASPLTCPDEVEVLRTPSVHLRPPKANILKPRKFQPIDYDLTSKPYEDKAPDSGEFESPVRPVRSTRASAKKPVKNPPSSSKKRNIR